jgi:predicted transposase YbfD/YdcC
VQGQVAVDAKSNEITAFVPLLDQLDLTGVVITADAMHTQDAHAKYLHGRGAHYVLIAKQNRPTLVRELTSLPWMAVKVAFTCTNGGHGRAETRTIKVVRPPRRLSFPHARQAIRLQRRRRARGGKVQIETVFAVTDLDFDRATPAAIAQIIRGHWSIENQVHYVRDMTFDEDRSQTRIGTSAQVMSTFRNIAIAPAPRGRGPHDRPCHPRGHAPTRTHLAAHHIKTKSRNPCARQERHAKIKNENALPMTPSVGRNG